MLFSPLVQNGQPARLGMILISCSLELFFQAGAGRDGLAIHEHSKLAAFIMRFNRCWPPVRLTSVLCEDQARSPIIFLLDGYFF